MAELALPLTETEFLAYPPEGSYQLQQLTECGWEPLGNIESKVARITGHASLAEYRSMRLIDLTGRVVWIEGVWLPEDVAKPIVSF